MAVTLVAHTKAGAAAASSLTTSAIDTTGASLLVVNLSSYSGSAAPTISDSKGNAWTALTAYTTPTQQRNQLFYCSKPTVGSGHTFTTSTVASSFAAVCVAAFSGTVPSCVAEFDVGNHNDNSAPNSIQPGSATPKASGELIVTGLGWTSSSVVTIDSSFIISDQNDYSSGQSYAAALGYLAQNASAAVNPTWSGTTMSDVTVAMTSFPTATLPLRTARPSQRGPVYRRSRRVNPVLVSAVVAPAFPTVNRRETRVTPSLMRRGRMWTPTPAWFPTTPILDPLSGRAPESLLSYYGAWNTAGGLGPLGGNDMQLFAGGAGVPPGDTAAGYANSSWQASCALPVELYATIATAPDTGSGAYLLFLSSPTASNAVGYFVFVGFNSGGISGAEIVRQDVGSQTALWISPVGIPGGIAAVGDRFGLTISATNVLTYWYCRSGAQWVALGSVVDSTYTGAGYLTLGAFNPSNLPVPLTTNFGGGTSRSQLLFQPNPLPWRSPATARRSLSVPTRGRRAFPTPAQVPVPPAIPGNRFPRARRIAALRRGRIMPPTPSQDSRPERRVPAARRIAAVVRGRRWFPTQPQIPVPPFIPPNRAPSTARRLFALVPRGKRVQPAQGQQTVIPPTVPGNRAPAGRRLAALRRGRMAVPTAAQSQPVTPVGARRRIAAVVRGRRWFPTPAQVPVPPFIPPNRAPATARRSFELQPRGRRWLPTPPQVPVPILVPAIRVEALARRLALAARRGRRTLPTGTPEPPAVFKPQARRTPQNVAARRGRRWVSPGEQLGPPTVAQRLRQRARLAPTGSRTDMVPDAEGPPPAPVRPFLPRWQSARHVLAGVTVRRARAFPWLSIGRPGSSAGLSSPSSRAGDAWPTQQTGDVSPTQDDGEV